MININKSKALVIGSVFTLIALTVIQGYLIYNTYQLKKKSSLFDARSTIAKIYNTKEVDSIMWLYRNDFISQLKQFKSGEITKTEVLKNLKLKTESINPLFLDLFNSGLEKNDLSYNVKMRITVASIILKDSLKTSSVLLDESESPIFLLGENFDNDEAILINNSTWNQDFAINETDKIRFDSLMFRAHIYMHVGELEQYIVRQMTGLLLLSCLLFLFVTGILFYSINNLLKLKRISEIKTDFINNITHELKTPLSTLSIATKTLVSSHAQDNPSIAKDAIATINRQNVRLQKLIDQVVNNSVGYNEIVLNKKEIIVSVFLDQIIEDFKLTLPKDIKINKSITGTEYLKVDKFYISTAVLNILSNAVKYNGTIINVNYNYNPKTNIHIIRIKDNGIGISKNNSRLIFNKFFRVSEKDTHNFKGLGLGLFYTMQIIKAHNGTIEVKSELDKGTEFTIKI